MNYVGAGVHFTIALHLSADVAVCPARVYAVIHVSQKPFWPHYPVTPNNNYVSGSLWLKVTGSTLKQVTCRAIYAFNKDDGFRLKTKCLSTANRNKLGGYLVDNKKLRVRDVVL